MIIDYQQYMMINKTWYNNSYARLLRPLVVTRQWITRCGDKISNDVSPTRITRHWLLKLWRSVTSDTTSVCSA